MKAFPLLAALVVAGFVGCKQRSIEPPTKPSSLPASSAMAIPPGIIPADTMAKDNGTGPEVNKSKEAGPSNGSTAIGGVVGGQAAGGGRSGGTAPQATGGDAVTKSTRR